MTIKSDAQIQRIVVWTMVPVLLILLYYTYKNYEKTK